MYNPEAGGFQVGLRGVLHVEVIRAVKLKDWGILFPAIRPYVRLICGPTSQQTEARSRRAPSPRAPPALPLSVLNLPPPAQVQMKDRLNPVWNASFSFQVTEQMIPAVLRADVIHASKKDPRIVGTCLLQFDKMALDKRVVDQPVPIKRRDGKVTGELHLKMTFEWDSTRMEEINAEREQFSRRILGDMQNRPGVGHLWASGMDDIGIVPKVTQADVVESYDPSTPRVDPRTVPQFNDDSSSSRTFDGSPAPPRSPVPSPSLQPISSGPDPPAGAWGAQAD
eukprot:tig00020562_g11152.t1